MTDAVSVAGLILERKTLEATFVADKAGYQEAQKALSISKARLTVFNNKYGRVLDLVKED
jgi:hypothetical protein